MMPTLHPEVITALQTSVVFHWTAIRFYTEASIHFDRWGYSKLASHFKGEADDEIVHVRKLTERLEFGDVAATPTDMIPKPLPRHDAKGVFVLALKLETDAARIENAGAVTARERSDDISAQVFADILQSSDASIREITAVLKVIEQIGMDNYLQAQL